MIKMKCRRCRRWFAPYIVDHIQGVAISSSICRKCREKEKEEKPK